MSKVRIESQSMPLNLQAEGKKRRQRVKKNENDIKEEDVIDI